MGKHSAAVRRCYTRQRMAGRAGASALYCCGCGEQVSDKADRLLKHANGCQALSRTGKWRTQRDVLQQAVSSDGAETTITNFFFSCNVAFSSVDNPSFRNLLQRLAPCMYHSLNISNFHYFLFHSCEASNGEEVVHNLIGIWLTCT